MNSNLIISPECSLLDALKCMDQNDKKLLVVCSEHLKFEGVLSVGDVQRAILNKIDLSESVDGYMRKKIIFASDKDDMKTITAEMKERRIESMPVVNSAGVLCDIIEWDEILGLRKHKKVGPYPVVIMAGGEGQRLKPLTNLIPKPLIPISEKSVIEEIMDGFVEIGCTSFYLSINYMADVIKEYFERINNSEYNINYFQEMKPLGTAGSLYLIRNQINDTFIVSNCDILVDVEYSDLIAYHKNNGNMATIVSAVKEYKIPYGTLETKENGLLKEITEKPTFTYQINTGLYVLEPEVFRYIEDDKFMHITTLFEKIISDGGNVGVFPISEGAWTDMGNWDEYMKIIKRG